eukprot:3326272-Prymnesium_polylepis.1
MRVRASCARGRRAVQRRVHAARWPRDAPASLNDRTTSGQHAGQLKIHNLSSGCRMHAKTAN